MRWYALACARSSRRGPPRRGRTSTRPS
jgi:hypothetical protein